MNTTSIDYRSINGRIRSCLAKTLEIPFEEIRNDVDIGEYGADSLVMALVDGDMNAHFGIPVPYAEDMAHISTVEDLSEFFLQSAQNLPQ